MICAPSAGIIILFYSRRARALSYPILTLSFLGFILTKQLGRLCESCAYGVSIVLSRS